MVYYKVAAVAGDMSLLNNFCILYFCLVGISVFDSTIEVPNNTTLGSVKQHPDI